MTGAHPLDRTSLEGGPTDHANALAHPKELRSLAFSLDLGHAHVDPDVADVILAAVEKLKSDFPEADERTRTWVSPDEAAEMVQEKGLRKLLRDF